MTDLINLETSVVISPFLSLPMGNLTFGSPEIQENQVLFSNFGHEVWLTPTTQGIQIPTSIYEYLSDNFFSWICQEIENFSDYEQTYFDVSQSYLAVDECQCRGKDYQGMPSI